MQPFFTQQERFRYRDITGRPVIDALVASSSDEPQSIDELITAALSACEKLPGSFKPYIEQIQVLHSRLAHGRLHLAVIGEFNRGKSTFINGLIGERLLPTSVLPITTIPTRIIFGPELFCTINFLNNKPPVTVRNSRESITAALLKYVAEQNNPKNQYCVDTVEVQVPSPLLENGTVLIDTPGFGSTYLHNTQTALEALANCDAALFLLSADPPMTRTEVEFLKQVMHHVPRLFFLLNKVDLLTVAQVRQVDDFISSVLAAHLPPSEQPRIFHICARKAETAAEQSPDDSMWTASGMEAVKVDIVNFMAREKYFTLSQAINDKLRETINGIVGLLEKERGFYEAPLKLLNHERGEFTRELDNLKKTVEKEQALFAAEKKAVLKFLDELFTSGKPKLVRQLHDAMTILLDSSSCSSEALRNVSTALRRIIPEALSAFRTRLLAQVNRPIKKAILLHQKTFTDTAAAIAVCLDGNTPQPDRAFHEKMDTLELDIDNPPAQPEGAAAFNLSLQWNDIFFGRENRVKRLHQRYDHHLESLLQEQLFLFSRQARLKVDQLFGQLDELLTGQYRQLSGQLEQILRRKEECVAEIVERNNRSTTALATRIETFNRISVRLF